jgi:hypothetical protein
MLCVIFIYLLVVYMDILTPKPFVSEKKVFTWVITKKNVRKIIFFFEKKITNL